MNKILLILILTTLSSCASINTPSSSLIDKVSVVTVGETSGVQEEHIVFIPANTEFPIQFSLKGNIFNKDLSSTVMASFKKDLYLYKYWASLDGKNWVNSHQLIDVKPSGGFDKSGGKVEVQLDLAQ